MVVGAGMGEVVVGVGVAMQAALYFPFVLVG